MCTGKKKEVINANNIQIHFIFTNFAKWKSFFTKSLLIIKECDFEYGQPFKIS